MLQVKKQGTRCVVEVERFQQDGLDLWGYYQEASFHLGSYQSEMDALEVWMALTKAEMEGKDLFVMPTDYKMNRRSA